MISFRILKQSKKSRARLGILKTPHGVIETPAFVPVATQGVVKTLTHAQVESTKTQLAIANTYHLYLRPGQDVIKKAKGLHAFTGWKKPLMTDSGGFQVLSLGFGQDYGIGKIMKHSSKEEITLGKQPKRMEITDTGVWFRSIIDGSRHFIGPKESIKIQEALGADIMFAFDEATSPLADYEYTKKSLVRSHEWEKQCLKVRKSKQALFGIVQGGKFKDLRIESALYIGSLPFDGFGIGGEYGSDKKKMVQMIEWVTDELPKEKPRHLLGIGYIEDIPKIIKAGVDTFDCIVPTHYARRGFAFTSRGKLDVRKRTFLNDRKPLDPACRCEVCERYSRSYITHLLRAGEITGMSLLTIHNLFYFNTFVSNLRAQIKKGLI